jgi:hypothetical protein
MLTSEEQSLLKRYDQFCCASCGAVRVRLYRPYSEFLRAERIACLAHVPADEQGWFVPLVASPDSEVWGYTSCPDDDMRLWALMQETVDGGDRLTDAKGMIKQVVEQIDHVGVD